MAKTKHFDFLLSIRKNLLTYLDNLTPEQLGYIPIGFSNNIFWNIAHCIAVQQFLCYQLSGNKLLISNDFLEKYNRGTFPQKIAPSKGEIYQVKELLLSTVNQLQEDYQTRLFNEFPTVKVGLFCIDTIEDAMYVNNMHESRHLGTVVALNYFSSKI